MVARQHATSREIADQACEEMRADKRIAQHRVTELEGDLAEEKKARHLIEQNRDMIVKQLGDLQEELRAAAAEIERLGREPAGIDHLLAQLRDPTIKADIRSTFSDIVANSAPARAE